jgi:Fe-S cluster assembly iron-binding protein IscA
MKYILTILITGLVLLSGCSSTQNKPSPLDIYWTNKGNTIEYKKFTGVKKWAPGQYVVIGNFDGTKKESVTKITVVRKEKTGWVYETITINKKGKTSGMQILVDGIDDAITKKDKTKISLVWIKVLSEDGSVQLMEGETLGFINALYKSQFDQYIVSNQIFEEGGPVTVPAGTFKGTTSIKSGINTSFIKKTFGVFMHPDVPVNGMVQARDENGNVVIELLDYGYNGKATIE